MIPNGAKRHAARRGNDRTSDMLNPLIDPFPGRGLELFDARMPGFFDVDERMRRLRDVGDQLEHAAGTTNNFIFLGKAASRFPVWMILRRMKD